MTERDRTIALYTFLREFVQLRTKTVRDISRYEQDGQVIWAADIPREHGCHALVGAGMDRIIHAHYVGNVEPLPLTARAQIALATIGTAAGPGITTLLDKDS